MGRGTNRETRRSSTGIEAGDDCTAASAAEGIIVNRLTKPDDSPACFVLQSTDAFGSDGLDDDGRLARTVARLAAANAELVEERDALRRDARRVAETKRATEALAKKYDAKFEKLRESLDAFRRAYPAPSNPANVLEPGAPAPSLDDLERDARELRAQLAAERDLGRKRDAIIARYEHWYSALKASAAARRRPSHEGSFEA